MRYVSQLGLALVALALLVIGISPASAQQATTSSSATMPTSLIMNGSFEDTTASGGFVHWNIYNHADNATLTPDTASSDVYSGRTSLKIVNTTDHSGQQWAVQLVSDAVKTTVGTTYQISFWVKSKTAGGSGRLSTSPSGGSISFYQPDWSTTTSWQLITWDIKADTANTQISFDMGALANTYYIDDVHVADTSQVAYVMSPTMLMMKSVGVDTVQIAWNPSAMVSGHMNSLQMYDVYRGAATDTSISQMTMVGTATDTVFVDKGLSANTKYRYAVTAVDMNNRETFSSNWITVKTKMTTPIEKGPAKLPEKFALHDNYPNPFNPTTNISYDLPKAEQVMLSVYNVLGKRVAVLVQSHQSAGNHMATFDASNLSSGVYFYRLQAGNHIMVKKMLLMK